MRSGGFPGQLAAIKERVAQIRAEAEASKKESERAKVRASRRLFLGASLGGVVGACAGGVGGSLFGAARARSAEAAPPDGLAAAVDPELAQALRLAEEPVAELMSRGLSLLPVLQRHPDDVRLWLGVVRLWLAASDRPAGETTTVMAALRAVARITPPPSDLKPLIDDLMRRTGERR